jgi:hypothetical protein
MYEPVEETIHKVADEIDMASELEMLFNQAAQKAVVARLLPEHHPDFNGTDCLVCEEPLTPLRVNMHRMRCVPCQEEHDKQRKMYAK